MVSFFIISGFPLHIQAQLFQVLSHDYNTLYVNMYYFSLIFKHGEFLIWIMYLYTFYQIFIKQLEMHWWPKHLSFFFFIFLLWIYRVAQLRHHYGSSRPSRVKASPATTCKLTSCCLDPHNPLWLQDFICGCAAVWENQGVSELKDSSWQLLTFIWILKIPHSHTPKQPNPQSSSTKEMFFKF